MIDLQNARWRQRKLLWTSRRKGYSRFIPTKIARKHRLLFHQRTDWHRFEQESRWKTTVDVIRGHYRLRSIMFHHAGLRFPPPFLLQPWVWPSGEVTT